MEMQMTSRGHRGLPRLQEKELAPPDRDLCIIDGIAENAARKGGLALGKAAFPADGTDFVRHRQRESLISSCVSDRRPLRALLPGS